jgi:hypothetical protein
MIKACSVTEEPSMDSSFRDTRANAQRNSRQTPDPIIMEPTGIRSTCYVLRTLFHSIVPHYFAVSEHGKRSTPWGSNLVFGSNPPELAWQWEFVLREVEILQFVPSDFSNPPRARLL